MAGSGWALRPQKGTRIITVRLWINGVESERTTGTTEREQALKVGALIFADEVRRAAGQPAPKRVEKLDVNFAGSLALWLAHLTSTHAPKTLEIWELWARKWIDFFGELYNFTSGTCQAYVSDRLTKVRRQSVKREVAALRSFARFAHERRLTPELVPVPSAPKNAAGTASALRRRVAAPPLSPAQVDAFLAALPELSPVHAGSPEVHDRCGFARYPIRDRFLVQYETGLRPSTMDRIRAPEHYRIGASTLLLSDDTDKVKFGREVPLTPRARAALDRVLSSYGADFKGLIFGVHNYKKQVRAAALASLPPEIAERFCAAHLRSARITHLLERPQVNIVGVQFLAGHKQLTTTNKYVRPSFRAAFEALGLEPEPTKPRACPTT